MFARSTAQTQVSIITEKCKAIYKHFKLYCSDKSDDNVDYWGESMLVQGSREANASISGNNWLGMKGVSMKGADVHKPGRAYLLTRWARSHDWVFFLFTFTQRPQLFESELQKQYDTKIQHIETAIVHISSHLVICLCGKWFPKRAWSVVSSHSPFSSHFSLSPMQTNNLISCSHGLPAGVTAFSNIATIYLALCSQQC